MSKRRPSQISTLKEFLKSAVVVIGASILVRSTVVQAYHVTSGSMEDTILTGDFVIADKITYGTQVPDRLPFFETKVPSVRLPGFTDPEPGALVIIESPEDESKDLFKRCIAVAGQTIEIRNKVIYIDGSPFDNPPGVKNTDPRVLPARFIARDNYAPYKVPEGHIFVVGDNRDNSRDSRHWGLLPSHMVVGRAFGVYWSCEPAPRPSSALAVAGGNVPNAFSRVRWERLGEWVH